MKKALFAMFVAGLVLACTACTAPRKPAARKQAEQEKGPQGPRPEPKEPEAKEPAVSVKPAVPEPVTPTEKVGLFNGKDLAGWKLFVKGDADPAETFKVEDGVITCTGAPSGYMRTENSYEDYKLTVEWRFVRAGDGPANSGVLVHMSPPDRVWPKSIECQGMHMNQGDFFVIGGADFKERAELPVSRITGLKTGKQPRRVPKRGPSNEHPIGDWNVYEIYCRGDTVRPYVNGKLMNEATECTVAAGSICIQSEGAAWECRRITIEPVPTEEPDAAGEITLFNGKDLAGWKVHLGGGADPAGTFKVEDGVIKCAGKPPGYMRTEEDYDNYKLTVEWRFLKAGNSGLLVHMSLPDKVWPKSIECQGMHMNQGDFFVIGGTDFKERVKLYGGKQGRRVPKRGPSNENPLGEWNVYEVVCSGGTVRPYVNGKLMNEATECTVTRGKVCIQSEGAAWECRRITVGPVPPGEYGSGKAPPGPPDILPAGGMIAAETDVKIVTEVERSQIRYTLDGSEPSKDSTLYEVPFRLDRDATVKARAYGPGGWKSYVAVRKYRLLPPAPPAPDVHISDLKPVKSVSGWGGEPKKDRSIEKNPLRVGGKRYEKGMGTHAPSEIVFGLKPGYRRFVAVTGLDNEASGRGGSVTFQVYADGELIGESPRLVRNDVWYFDVAIPEGARQLRLVVADAGDGIGCDHGDWVNAGFVTGGR